MSMVDPSIDYLAEKVDSKYTLVILAAKRARELTIPGVNSAEKEVSAALKDRVTACTIDRAPRKWTKPSDHAPVVLTLAD